MSYTKRGAAVARQIGIHARTLPPGCRQLRLPAANNLNRFFFSTDTPAKNLKLQIDLGTQQLVRYASHPVVDVACRPLTGAH